MILKPPSCPLCSSADVLILAEILIALAAMSGFLILVTVLCYRKRKWYCLVT